MKYVAAYLLTVLGGKEPTKENLEALLGSVGIDWEARGDTLLSALEGKDLAEVIKAGEEMLVKGGGGPGHLIGSVTLRQTCTLIHDVTNTHIHFLSPTATANDRLRTLICEAQLPNPHGSHSARQPEPVPLSNLAQLTARWRSAGRVSS